MIKQITNIFEKPKYNISVDAKEFRITNMNIKSRARVKKIQDKIISWHNGIKDKANFTLAARSPELKSLHDLMFNITKENNEFCDGFIDRGIAMILFPDATEIKKLADDLDQWNEINAEVLTQDFIEHYDFKGINKDFGGEKTKQEMIKFSDKINEINAETSDLAMLIKQYIVCRKTRKAFANMQKQRAASGLAFDFSAARELVR